MFLYKLEVYPAVSKLKNSVMVATFRITLAALFYILRAIGAKSHVSTKKLNIAYIFDHEFIWFDMLKITFRYFIFSQLLLV